MALLIVFGLVVAWCVAWWGYPYFEITGIARRIERTFDRRYTVRDDDGVAMAAARGAWIGVVTFFVTWVGFLVPAAVLVLLGIVLN